MNAGAAAEAARLSVAADAAARRVGVSAAAPGPDRSDRQTTFRQLPARAVRAPAEAETHREDRVRAGAAPLRRGPNPFFVAQYLAQEAGGDARPRAAYAEAVAHYPSLAFEAEIFLPGEDIVLVDSGPRVDFLV